MYLEYYKLRVKPFSISPDPSFLWMSEKHKEALATLRYGVQDNKGFLLLTGDVGTGKTTLINALCNGLGPDVLVVNVPDPGFDRMDFFNFVASAFKINKKISTKVEFILYFTRFLQQAYNQKKRVLIIIDEAQRLSNQLLEEIRALSNIERQTTKLVNIFFVGQNEFNDMLLDKRNRALRQRITLNYNIEPLNREETGQYIAHRFNVAGTKNTIFTKRGTKEIFARSGGYPRLINVICDHALLTGYVNGARIISSSIIKDCARELKIPVLEKNTNTEQTATFQELGSGEGWITRTMKSKFHFQSWIIFLLILTLGVTLLSQRDAWWNMFQMMKMNPPVVRKFPAPTQPVKVEIIHKYESPQNASVVSDLEKRNNNPEKKEEYRNEGQLPENFRAVRSGQSEKRNTSDLSEIRKKMYPLIDNAMNRKTVPNRGAISFPDEHIEIQFRTNSNSLSSGAYKQLAPMVAALKRISELNVIIRGYSDNVGSKRYNRNISEFRANMVKSYFLGKGIAPDRIKTVGMGEKNPVASNKTVNGRKANRRVEIVLINGPVR